jgi:hypothetical protein
MSASSSIRCLNGTPGSRAFATGGITGAVVGAVMAILGTRTALSRARARRLVTPQTLVTIPAARSACEVVVADLPTRTPPIALNAWTWPPKSHDLSLLAR